MNLTNGYLIAKQQREEFEANRPRSWSRGKRGIVQQAISLMYGRLLEEHQAVINQGGPTNEQEEENLF